MVLFPSGECLVLLFPAMLCPKVLCPKVLCRAPCVAYPGKMNKISEVEILDLFLVDCASNSGV